MSVRALIARSGPTVAWGVLALLVGMLVAVLAPLEVLLLGLFLGVALGSLCEPLIGIGAGLVLGLLRAWLMIFMPQLPDQLGQLFFLLGMIGWIARGLLRRDFRLTLGPLMGPLLLFLGAGLFSLWFTVDVWLGFTEWAKWAQILLTVWIVGERLQDVRGRERAMALVLVMGGVGVWQGALGIWQHMLRGAGPPHFRIAPGVYRAYGTFMQPNPFGGFLGMVAALLLGMVCVALWEAVSVRRWPAGWLWPAGAATLVSVGGLYSSWSRGAWMGFAMALTAMAVLLPRRRLWGVVLVLTLALALLGLALANLLPATLTARFTDFMAYTRFEDVRGVGINDANYAVIERMAHWQAALGMWQDHFWTGVGIGNYEAAYPRYRLLNWPYALGHAHNIYLNLLAEMGVLGLSAYMLLLLAIYRRLWQATRWLSGWPRGLALGLVGAWTQLHVHNLVDNLYVNNLHLYVGVLLALTAWLNNARPGEKLDVNSPQTVASS